MKKFLHLALLIFIGCIATTSRAVHLNSGGIGEVLLYPYYTIENGQDTYFLVVNTSDRVKAVKVRLRESMNAAEVLSFNLYLSPLDHWAGSITRDPDSEGALLTAVDRSCTVPRITTAGVKLISDNYSTDGGPQGVERTREGFIEIIEMGIVDDSAPGAFGAEAAATHATGGRPPVDCDLLRAAWEETPQGSGITSGNWNNPNNNMIFDADLAGGLFGFGTIINVPEGTNATYDAQALEAFASEILHSRPGSDLPNLGSALPHSKIVDEHKFVALEFDSAQSGLDAVSSVLMQSKIANDFVLEPSIAAATDWVVTLPTKRHYVNSSAVNGPFLSTWEEPGVACEQVELWMYWDREGQQGDGIDTYVPPDIDFPISPVPRPPVEWPYFGLCGSVNVISFLGPDISPDDENLDAYRSALYPSERSHIPFSVQYYNGWGDLFLGSDRTGINHRILTADNGTQLYGLPVVGFAVQKYSNTNLQGITGSGAYYSGLINHKTSRRIELQP